MDATQRTEVERRIVKAAVDGLLAAGYAISVYDGGDWPVERSRDADIIMAGLFACDEEWLQVYTSTSHDTEPSVGSVWLIYGNDGYDVIADNSLTLNEALAQADKLSDQFCDAISNDTLDAALAGQPSSCNWHQEDDDGAWHSDCGSHFTLNEGTPSENGMAYCHKCGKPLQEHPWTEDDQEGGENE